MVSAMVNIPTSLEKSGLNTFSSGASVGMENNATSVRDSAIAQLAAVSKARATDRGDQSQQDKAFSSAELAQAVNEINTILDTSSTGWKFYVDESVQRFVVEVKDSDTGELIAKYPAESALRIAESLETLKGVLFDRSL